MPSRSGNITCAECQHTMAVAFDQGATAVACLKCGATMPYELPVEEAEHVAQHSMGSGGAAGRYVANRVSIPELMMISQLGRQAVAAECTGPNGIDVADVVDMVLAVMGSKEALFSKDAWSFFRSDAGLCWLHGILSAFLVEGVMDARFRGDRLS